MIAMASKKTQRKRAEEGVKLLKRRYAKWKEKQSPGRRLDYEELLACDPDELDLEEQKYWS